MAQLTELLNAMVNAGPSAPTSAAPDVVDAGGHALAARPTERAATDIVDVVVEDDEVLAALVVKRARDPRVYRDRSHGWEDGAG